MPVGRIRYMHLEPFSFEEFLQANGKEGFVQYIQTYRWGTEIPIAIHEELLASFKEYLIVGGMPAAVSSWIEDRSLLKVNQIHHDPVYLAQRVNDPAITFTASGTEKIGDVEAAVLDVGGAVPWIRWYLDPKSGRILREAYKGLGQTGSFQGETELGDWRTADGVTLPYLHRNKQNGKDSSIVQYTSIQINPSVDPKLFEKPKQ